MPPKKKTTTKKAKKKNHAKKAAAEKVLQCDKAVKKEEDELDTHYIDILSSQRDMYDTILSEIADRLSKIDTQQERDEKFEKAFQETEFKDDILKKWYEMRKTILKRAASDLRPFEEKQLREMQRIIENARDNVVVEKNSAEFNWYDNVATALFSVAGAVAIVGAGTIVSEVVSNTPRQDTPKRISNKSALDMADDAIEAGKAALLKKGKVAANAVDETFKEQLPGLYAARDRIAQINIHNNAKNIAIEQMHKKINAGGVWANQDPPAGLIVLRYINIGYQGELTKHRPGKDKSGIERTDTINTYTTKGGEAVFIPDGKSIDSGRWERETLKLGNGVNGKKSAVISEWNAEKKTHVKYIETSSGFKFYLDTDGWKEPGNAEPLFLTKIISNINIPKGNAMGYEFAQNLATGLKSSNSIPKTEDEKNLLQAYKLAEEKEKKKVLGNRYVHVRVITLMTTNGSTSTGMVDAFSNTSNTNTETYEQWLTEVARSNPTLISTKYKGTRELYNQSVLLARQELDSDPIAKLAENATNFLNLYYWKHPITNVVKVVFALPYGAKEYTGDLYMGGPGMGIPGQQTLMQKAMGSMGGMGMMMGGMMGGMGGMGGGMGGMGGMGGGMMGGANAMLNRGIFKKQFEQDATARSGAVGIGASVIQGSTLLFGNHNMTKIRDRYEHTTMGFVLHNIIVRDEPGIQTAFFGDLTPLSWGEWATVGIEWLWSMLPHEIKGQIKSWVSKKLKRCTAKFEEADPTWLFKIKDKHNAAVNAAAVGAGAAAGAGAAVATAAVVGVGTVATVATLPIAALAVGVGVFTGVTAKDALNVFFNNNAYKKYMNVEQKEKQRKIWEKDGGKISEDEFGKRWFKENKKGLLAQINEIRSENPLKEEEFNIDNIEELTRQDEKNKKYLEMNKFKRAMKDFKPVANAISSEKFWCYAMYMTLGGAAGYSMMKVINDLIGSDPHDAWKSYLAAPIVAGVTTGSAIVYAKNKSIKSVFDTISTGVSGMWSDTKKKIWEMMEGFGPKYAWAFYRALHGQTMNIESLESMFDSRRKMIKSIETSFDSMWEEHKQVIDHVNIIHMFDHYFLNYIGQLDFKQTMYQLYLTILRQEHISTKARPSLSLNYQFVGNPGTGKTEAAKIFSKFLFFARFRTGNDGRMNDNENITEPSLENVRAQKAQNMEALGNVWEILGSFKHAASSKSEGAVLATTLDRGSRFVLRFNRALRIDGKHMNIYNTTVEDWKNYEMKKITQLLSHGAPASSLWMTSAAELLLPGQSAAADMKSKIEQMHKNGGGVVVIDEAYSLKPKTDSNGRQVYDILLLQSENFRSNTTFIMIGYEKDIARELMAFNPGMSRRFPNVIHFRNFNRQQMTAYWKLLLRNKCRLKGNDIKLPIRGWAMTGDNIKLVVARLLLQEKQPDFGNVATERQMFDRAVEHAMERLRLYNRKNIIPTFNITNKSELKDELSLEECRALQIPQEMLVNNNVFATTNNDEPICWLVNNGVASKKLLETLPEWTFGTKLEYPNPGNVLESQSDPLSIPYIKMEDIIGPDPATLPELNDILNEFIGKPWNGANPKGGYVGLHKVKREIKELVAVATFNWKQEKAGKPTVPIMLNKLFMGKPGTGKTSVAKFWARTLKALSLVSDGSYQERAASDFIGAVVGESQTKTNSILKGARGKVLFIDEAYVLAESDFGLEVLNTIVEQVQAKPGADRAVIMAGYTKEMTSMVRNVNPGLGRRFDADNPVEFDDFDDNELKRILKMKAKSSNTLVLKSAIDYAVGEIAKNRPNKDFGNAGSVENSLNAAIKRAMYRVQRYKEEPKELKKSLEMIDLSHLKAQTAKNTTEEADITEDLQKLQTAITSLLSQDSYNCPFTAPYTAWDLHECSRVKLEHFTKKQKEMRQTLGEQFNRAEYRQTQLDVYKLKEKNKSKKKKKFGLFLKVLHECLKNLTDINDIEGKIQASTENMPPETWLQNKMTPETWLQNKMTLTDKAAIPSKVWGNKSAIENELRLAILTIAAECPKDLLEASPEYEKDHYNIIESGKSTFAVDGEKVFKKKFEAVTESDDKTPEQIANQQGWYKSIKSVDNKQFIKVEENVANEDGWYIPGTQNIITEIQEKESPPLTNFEVGSWVKVPGVNGKTQFKKRDVTSWSKNYNALPDESNWKEGHIMLTTLGETKVGDYFFGNLRGNDRKKIFKQIEGQLLKKTALKNTQKDEYTLNRKNKIQRTILEKIEPQTTSFEDRDGKWITPDYYTTQLKKIKGLRMRIDPSGKTKGVTNMTNEQGLEHILFEWVQNEDVFEDFKESLDLLTKIEEGEGALREFEKKYKDALTKYNNSIAAEQKKYLKSIQTLEYVRLHLPAEMQDEIYAAKRFEKWKPGLLEITRQDFGWRKSMDPVEKLKKNFRDFDHITDYIASKRDEYSFAKELWGGNDRSKLPTQPHLIFSGNSGTGKTSAAKAMAQAFFEVGLLASDRTITRSASDLEGTHVGEAQEIVEKTMEEAVGGILLIDEAYELGKSEYGRQAQTKLIALLTDDRFANGNVVVILCGYKPDMDKMKARNQGMASRFGQELFFKDMSTDTACEVIVDLLKKNFLTFPPSSTQQDALGADIIIASDVFSALRLFVKDIMKLNGWGNFRDCKSICSNIKRHVYTLKSRGLSNPKSVQAIVDFKESYNQYIQSEMKQSSQNLYIKDLQEKDKKEYFTREAKESFKKDLREEEKKRTEEETKYESVDPVLKELTVNDIAMGCRDMLLNRQDVPRRRKGVNRQTFKQQEYEFEQKRKDWEDFWKNKDQKYKQDNKEYTKEDVHTSLKIWKHSQKLKIRAKLITTAQKTFPEIRPATRPDRATAEGGLTAPTISVVDSALDTTVISVTDSSVIGKNNPVGRKSRLKF